MSGSPKGIKPWNAGKGNGWTDKRGYRWIYVTENGKRRAKREHRDIVEKNLGRALSPEEIVHHINGDPSDNRIENLQVTTLDAHTVGHHNGTTRTDVAKRRMEVMANYREEHKRLRAINTELLEALKEVEGGALFLNRQEYRVTNYAMNLVKKAIVKAEGK